VRHRTTRTENCVSRSTFLGVALKLAEEATKTWRRIGAPEKAAELLAGICYEDGIPVTDDRRSNERPPDPALQPAGCTPDLTIPPDRDDTLLIQINL
jgi:hypothetical protein